MFNKYNFKISKADLKELFKIVDDDGNGILKKYYFLNIIIND